METSKITEPQRLSAERIVANLKADGRFEGKLWAKDGKCRVYVEGGYIAVGQDGKAYPELRRYRGNIARAAGI